MTPLSSTITEHEKCIKILNMIAECDKRFENHLFNYRSLFGTSKDYDRAQFSMQSKGRLQIYYKKKLLKMTLNEYEIDHQHSSNDNSPLQYFQ